MDKLGRAIRAVGLGSVLAVVLAHSGDFGPVVAALAVGTGVALAAWRIRATDPEE